MRFHLFWLDVLEKNVSPWSNIIIFLLATDWIDVETGLISLNFGYSPI